jgi:hypothetical protein
MQSDNSNIVIMTILSFIPREVQSQYTLEFRLTRFDVRPIVQSRSSPDASQARSEPKAAVLAALLPADDRNGWHWLKVALAHKACQSFFKKPITTEHVDLEDHQIQRGADHYFF